MKAEGKLKSVKISEEVHTELKIFVAQHKVKNITSFLDGLLAKELERLKKITSKK